jgi:hypothetical protein
VGPPREGSDRSKHLIGLLAVLVLLGWFVERAHEQPNGRKQTRGLLSSLVPSVRRSLLSGREHRLTTANAFVTKPIGLTQFGAVVTAIEDFWFEVVAYRTRSDGRPYHQRPAVGPCPCR